LVPLRPVIVAGLVLLLLLPLVRTAEPTFFTVASRDGVWWLIDPQGRQTLSIGVNKVSQGDTPADWGSENPSYSARRIYDTDKAWQDRALARLTSWGFNTVGSYSDPGLRDGAGMPFTVALALGKTIGAPWIDLWSPDVEQAAAELARELTAPWRDNAQMIGYFVDNENPWWDETLFAYHLGTPWRTRSDAGGDAPWVVNQTKLRLFEIMSSHYGESLERLSLDWEFAGFLEDVETSTGVERVSSELESFDDLRDPVTLLRRLGTRPAVIDLFMAEVYERYGQLMSDAVKAADPNHLIIGERYQQFYNPAQVRAAGRWFDVISINYGARVQDGWVSPNHLAMLERLSGRPVLIGEYYFAASENSSGSRNSGTAYPVVKTQAERAAGFTMQVRQMASLPSVIGWHWFQYFDQPPEGDTSGEDFNMGLIDVFDREYPLMTEASTLVNSEAYALHERALPLPSPQPARPSVFAVPRAERPRSLTVICGTGTSPPPGCQSCQAGRMMSRRRRLFEHHTWRVARSRAVSVALPRRVHGEESGARRGVAGGGAPHSGAGPAGRFATAHDHLGAVSRGRGLAADVRHGRRATRLAEGVRRVEPHGGDCF